MHYRLIKIHQYPQPLYRVQQKCLWIWWAVATLYELKDAEEVLRSLASPTSTTVLREVVKGQDVYINHEYYKTTEWK